MRNLYHGTRATVYSIHEIIFNTLSLSHIVLTTFHGTTQTPNIVVI